MEYIHIDKLITTSIYKQIASSITDAINIGLLVYNDKLPTEKEICEVFGISNTAVKMAYEKLISEGKIKRIKGKGTYVTNRLTYRTDMHAFYGFSIINRKIDYIYSKDIILFEKEKKDFSVLRALKLNDDEFCYKMISLVKAKQNPILLQKTYLPEKYFPDFIKKYSKIDKIYDFIEKESNYKIKHLHNTFTAVNASSSDALLLNINIDDAISFVRTLIVNNDDRVIGYLCSYFPGDFTEFEVIVDAI